ncbi:MAG TPA: hypothetical protein VI958_11980 [Acidobacteriota bacterium]
MSFLKRAWGGWKKIARKIGDFQARLILGVFYFVIMGPLSLIIRRNDPLGIRKEAQRGWSPKAEQKGTPMERALQQS